MKGEAVRPSDVSVIIYCATFEVFHSNDKLWLMMGYYVLSTCRPWSCSYYDPPKCLLYNTGITFLALVKYKPHSSPFRFFFPGKHWLMKCHDPEKRTGLSSRDVHCTIAGIWMYYPNSKHMSLVRSALLWFCLHYSSYSITEQAREMLLPEDFSYVVMLCICLYRSRQVSELPPPPPPNLSSFGRKSMKGVNHFSRPEAVWHYTSRLSLPLQCLHKHAGSSLLSTSACTNIMIVFSFFVSSINSFSISEYKFVIKLYFMCFYEPLN